MRDPTVHLLTLRQYWLWRTAPEPPEPADHQPGLRDLARSFAAAFGPATVDDFAYWSGVKKSEARTVADRLDPAA